MKPRARSWVVLCVLALLFAQARAASKKCLVTDKTPFVPYGLELCYMHSHKACCLPGFDQEIQTAYSSLVPNGQGCGPGGQRIYASLYALRQYLCLPCDPSEPSYRFESVKGDIVDGGVVPPSAGSVAGEQTWRICRSFLYGAVSTNEGLWGDRGSRYAQCGVFVSSCMATPVFNITTATFEKPSSTCTPVNELVIPSVAFAGASDPAVTMLSVITQSMPDFQFVVVNDSDPKYDYNKTPCFGRNEAVGVVRQGAVWFACLVLLVVGLL
ncbi:hypothetical protein ABB37_00766 [Leptomonas pyrrhocoris]|uniref:Uncharacterized protein n=1 Tax=Leptomonas pyrrhocoris TaxID=157538 RepID=A0A0N0E0P0_LEPPY|nr:hypothetical protein ABB37_00766 [Leptomonas pyrrhocoris]KPA86665.1 hypothetical protein ABB37_00766 [Leptomonas pyrrhocoris]|eukprot:XP_015665104.1 hypothetical protein ABB37_00766 [Leptomonas pyrrhocoris]